MRQTQCIAILILSTFLWIGLINYYIMRSSNLELQQRKLVEELTVLEAALDEFKPESDTLLQDAKFIIRNSSRSSGSAHSKRKDVEPKGPPPTEIHIPHDENAIAVLLISCNRVTVSRCLDQLIRYRPSKERFPIIVSQDCVHEQTSYVIESYKKHVYHVHQPDQSDIFVPPKEKKFRGYFKIARHYKWALNFTFNRLNFNTVIVIEDDLDVSPDFYEYFAATLPVLQVDSSLWCVSAWNDNGKPELVDRNAVDLLYRTDFFPGLGWMLTKSLWQELVAKWPVSYWDDWMREPEQRRGRSCIRPELSRSRTFGKIGVSNGMFYDKHLKYIYLNNQLAEFTKKNLTYLRKDMYDPNFLRIVYGSPIVSLQELKAGKVYAEGPVRILYENRQTLKKITKSVGLMDDFKSGVPRTGYLGVISFFYRDRRVFLTPSSAFSGYESF